MTITVSLYMAYCNVIEYDIATLLYIVINNFHTC